MTIPYLEALAAITASLAILMVGAWVVQQRTGNAGRFDTVWTFSRGRVGAGGALYATGIPPLEAEMLRSRGDRYRGDQSRTSQFLPLQPQA